MAERSKAPDSSSGGAIRVGSNPTADMFFLGSPVSACEKHLAQSSRSTTARVHGATVARLTPDQTVGRSNRSGLTVDHLSTTS